jgi:threonine/homoserine/homoserine lactone efflux protein
VARVFSYGMNVASLWSLAVFAVAASITPGPNNAMLAATAANHGFRAAVPQALGVVGGITVMMAVVAFGMAGVVAALPGLARVLRVASLAWLLLLAWRIAHAGAPGGGPAQPPMGWLGAVAFQWVNPKAWFMALGAAAAWVLPGQALAPQAASIAGVFCVISVPCVLTWAALGSAAGRLLHSPRRLRAFNVAMAGLMVASMLPVVFGE